MEKIEPWPATFAGAEKSTFPLRKQRALPNRNRCYLFFDELTKGSGSLFSPFYWCLGPLHKSLVTGMKVVVCSLGKLQPGQLGCNSRNKTRKVEQKLVLFRLLYGFVDYFNFTTTSVVEKHTRQKLCHFCRYIAKVFCQKMFHPGHPGWSVHMENFSSPLPRSRLQGPRFG